MINAEVGVQHVYSLHVMACVSACNSPLHKEDPRYASNSKWWGFLLHKNSREKRTKNFYNALNNDIIRT